MGRGLSPLQRDILRQARQGRELRALGMPELLVPAEYAGCSESSRNHQATRRTARGWDGSRWLPQDLLLCDIIEAIGPDDAQRRSTQAAVWRAARRLEERGLARRLRTSWDGALWLTPEGEALAKAIG
jgi:hypothetical protein